MDSLHLDTLKNDLKSFYDYYLQKIKSELDLCKEDTSDGKEDTSDGCKKDFLEYKYIQYKSIYTFPYNFVGIFNGVETPRFYSCYWSYKEGHSNVLDFETKKYYYKGKFLTKEDVSNFEVVQPELLFIPYRFDMFESSDNDYFYHIKRVLNENLHTDKLELLKGVIADGYGLIHNNGMLYILRLKGSSSVYKVNSAEILGYTVYEKQFCPVVKFVLKELEVWFLVKSLNLLPLYLKYERRKNYDKCI